MTNLDLSPVTRYLLSVYQPEGDPPPPDVLGQIMSDLDAVNAEMQAAGVWVFSAGLHPPSTATVVRQHGGDLLTTDGPFAEGQEHLGGFTLVEAADLDAALDWARELTRASTLPVEVRPLQDETES